MTNNYIYSFEKGITQGRQGDVYTLVHEPKPDAEDTLNQTSIETIKIWMAYFLLPIFILVFSSVVAFAENTTQDSVNTSNQYTILMEKTVDDYKKIVENGGWPSFKIGKSIKIDAGKDDRIPVIRQILSIMGDYTNTQEQSPENSEILDEELIEAIKHFQVRHGLEADGAIGSKTQAALLIPAEIRLAQLEATLERMRKMPDLGEHYVLVNVPAFYLKAVDNNNTIFTSRIIVGTPKNSTPLFYQPITEVSFNPQWHVPDRIAREEFIEKIRSTPNYLEEGNYMVKDRNGNIVDGNDIDWENETGNNYKFIQRSGEKNALGKIKFNLPNTNSIYLHSTGSPKLFAKTERALSHGCIRVEKARDLAYFVMSGLDGWNEERIDKFYDSSNSRIIRITPVPVYLVYWTSWVDETTKQPHFQNDIYGREKERISEILAEIKTSNTKN